MSSSELVRIKRRINTVKNTRKITKAMGLIASSKLKKNSEILNKNEKYFIELEDALSCIFINKRNGIDNLYLDGNKSNKKIFIILTSDMGLCGGFNGEVIRKADEQMSLDKENSLVILVGEKGRKFIKRTNYETIAEYVDLSSLPSLKESKLIMYKALNMYRKNEVGEIYLVYTKYKSCAKYQIITERLLPLDLKIKKEASLYYEYEPSGDKLITEIIDVYLKHKIFYALANSKSSEQIARIRSMEEAVKNANELINKLNKKYNRIRQNTITQEISEIVGGTEAQK